MYLFTVILILRRHYYCQVTFILQNRHLLLLWRIISTITTINIKAEPAIISGIHVSVMLCHTPSQFMILGILLPLLKICFYIRLMLNLYHLIYGIYMWARLYRFNNQAQKFFKCCLKNGAALITCSAVSLNN